MNKTCTCLFIVLMFIVVGCKDQDSETNRTKWYVTPSSEYKHYLNPQEDAVAQWIQGEPCHFNKLGMFVESPYTYEEWLAMGKEIDGIEDILIDWYENYNGYFKPYIIFESLKYVGSFRSVPTLIGALEDDLLDVDSRNEAALALGVIGDPKAVNPLTEIVQNSKYDSDGYSGLKNNALMALEYIGSPETLSVVKELIENSQAEEDIRFYQRIRESLLKRQSVFVQDWILRWHEDADNSKELPPYRSETEWIYYGKKIPDVEKILMELLNNREKEVSDMSVLYSLGAVGTPEIIQELAEIIVKRDSFSYQERECGITALYEISPEKSSEVLLNKIEEKKVQKPDDALLLLDIFIPIYEKYLD